MVSRKVKIRRLPVCPLKVQAIHSSLWFWSLTFYHKSTCESFEKKIKQAQNFNGLIVSKFCIWFEKQKAFKLHETCSSWLTPVSMCCWNRTESSIIHWFWIIFQSTFKRVTLWIFISLETLLCKNIAIINTWLLESLLRFYSIT